MFMKWQMPPNAIATVPCTRYTFIPNTEPILFLPHFHIFLTYVSPQILSVLAQPQAYHPFNRGLHFLQVLSPMQISYNHHPHMLLRLQSLSSPTSPPHSWPIGSVSPNIYKFGFESAAVSLPMSLTPPVLITLPAFPYPSQPRCTKSHQPAKSNHLGGDFERKITVTGKPRTTLAWCFQSSTVYPNPEWHATTQTQHRRVLFTMENIFEGTKPQSAEVSIKNH